MSEVVLEKTLILVMEDMLRQVWEQAKIIPVLQEELQKVRARKEPIDGGGGIYVDLGVGRSEGVVAGNLSKDGDWQKKAREIRQWWWCGRDCYQTSLQESKAQLV